MQEEYLGRYLILQFKPFIFSLDLNQPLYSRGVHGGFGSIRLEILTIDHGAGSSFYYPKPNRTRRVTGHAGIRNERLPAVRVTVNHSKKLIESNRANNNINYNVICHFSKIK